LQFKVDSVCSAIFPNCGSFSTGPCRPLPYAKLNGTNLEIGTCRGYFSINKLLVEPLIARALTTSHGNSCLMTVAYSILSWIQQAMSFFVRSLEPPPSVSAIRLLDRKFYTASAYLQVSTTEFGIR